MKKLLLGYCMLMCLLLACNSTKKTMDKAEYEPSVKPPGTLKFLANSTIYAAEATFREWQFTKLDLPTSGITGMTARIEILINSVYERTIRLTSDLKKESYLNGVEFPKAYVDITNVNPLGGSDYMAEMKLTIKDITKTIKSKFTLLNDAPPYKVKGEVVLNRQDFGVAMKMGKEVKDKVVVQFETELKLSEE